MQFNAECNKVPELNHFIFYFCFSNSMEGPEKKYREEEGVKVTDSLIYFPPCEGAPVDCGGTYRFALPDLPTSYGPNPFKKGTAKHGFFEIYRPENAENHKLIEKVVQDAMLESGFFKLSLNNKNPEQFVVTAVSKDESD